MGIGNAVVFALYKPLDEDYKDKIASLVKLYGTAYKTIGIIVGAIGIALMPFLNVIIRNEPNIAESIYLLYIINLFLLPAEDFSLAGNFFYFWFGNLE